MGRTIGSGAGGRGVGGIGGGRDGAKDFGGRGGGEAGEPFGGYEDEGTWMEVEGDNVVNAVISTRETKKNSSSPFPSSSSREEGEECRRPILTITIPQMPVNAEAEVELIYATRVASDCLGGS